MTSSSKNKRLKNSLITRATFTMLTLLTVANPETKAQFVPAVGTAGNDTIIGSGNFTG
jgi:hypothetical protein